MLSHPVVFVLVLALLALFGFWFWSAWSARRVWISFINWRALFLFSFGLLALLARGRETVVIVSGDPLLELHGCCSKVTADFIVAVADDVAGQSVPAP